MRNLIFAVIGAVLLFSSGCGALLPRGTVVYDQRCWSPGGFEICRRTYSINNEPDLNNQRRSSQEPGRQFKYYERRYERPPLSHAPTL